LQESRSWTAINDQQQQKKNPNETKIINYIRVGYPSLHLVLIEALGTATLPPLT
jgi:hypothetical protein